MVCGLFLCMLLATYYYVPTYFGDTIYPLKYADFIRKYSVKYNVDPTLVAAVIMVESRFNPASVSGAGAQGLMQFMPGTAATMAKETGRWPKYDIFDAETSVEFGAAHLRDLLNKYNGNVGAALTAYNTGTGTVDGLIRSGTLGDGNGYSKKVQNAQTVYKTMYANDLGVEPVKLEQAEDTDSAVRGFVWSQIFSNFSKAFGNNK